MKSFRFGQKIKVPSTMAIKHEILSKWLNDEILVSITSKKMFDADSSPAVHALRKLMIKVPNSSLAFS